MTAEVYRYDEDASDWVWHDSLHDGVIKKGVVPNTNTPFEAKMEPGGRGFKTEIDKKIQVVAPGQTPVEYWRHNPMFKTVISKFRLIAT
jgi:hypothetical protein